MILTLKTSSKAYLTGQLLFEVGGSDNPGFFRGPPKNTESNTLIPNMIIKFFENQKTPRKGGSETQNCDFDL